MADAGYGDTHSGKTKALERLAVSLFERTGKRTRVYIGDGGGETYNDVGAVDEGIIELWDYSVHDYPMTVLKLMTDFWWPRDWRDTKSKLVAPTSDLTEKYALMVFEGGTVIGNWMLSDVPGGMSWHAATESGFGGIKDEDGVLSTEDNFKFAEGDKAKEYLDQGANSPRHYMIVQRKLVNAIRRSKVFPGLVYWTFHPTEGPDRTQGGESGKYGTEIKGKKIIGPDAGGKALASTIAKEFGNLHHYDQVTFTTKVKDETTQKQITTVTKEFRLYTRRHFDPDQLVMTEYVAGTRRHDIPDYFISKAPGDSLLQFYQSMADSRRKEMEKKG